MKNKNLEILILLAFSFLLLFIFSNKVFILLYICFFTFLFFFLKKNLLESFFLTAIFALPFERGIRDWIVYIVQPGPESWIEGYYYYFTISMKMVLIVFSFFLLPFQKVKNRITSFPKILLLLFLISTILSSLGSINPFTSFLTVIKLIISLSFFFIGLEIFQNKNNKDIALKILSVNSITLSIAGLIQFINQKPIGLFLEETNIFSPLGYTSNDGIAVYRSIGLLGHPTFYGVFMAMMIPINYIQVIKSFKNNSSNLVKVTYLFSLLLSIFSSITSMSRSAWLSILFMSVMFLYFHKDLILRKDIYRNLKDKFIFKITLITSIVFILISWKSIFLRSLSFINILQSPNSTGRFDLINRSLSIIKENFWFGVGPNFFTHEMNTYNLSLKEATFLKPVHNLPLLIWSESGFFAILSISLFFLFVIYSYNIKSKKMMIHGTFLSIIVFIFNSQFHALYLHDPTFDSVLLIAALYLNAKN